MFKSGFNDAYASADFWLSKSQHGELSYPLMRAETKQRYRQQSLESVACFNDLKALTSIDIEEKRSRIQSLSQPLPNEAFLNGEALSQSKRQWFDASLKLDALEAGEPAFAIVTERTSMRRFPSALAVQSHLGEGSIDYLQETDVFIGDIVAILHPSLDGAWAFVLHVYYAGWVELKALALTEKETALAYEQRCLSEDALLVTGGYVETVYHPSLPQLSEKKLVMGSAFPVVHASEPLLHGQCPWHHYVIELPTRDTNGNLHFQQVLIPKNADVSIGTLAYTRENIIKQAFKFLGSRYSWGGAISGCDCSSLLVHVFNSLGVLLPRNAGQQVKEGLGVAQKDGMNSSLLLGDALYFTGHVMLYLGEDQGRHYVIHAVGGQFFAGKSMRICGVAVTSLTDLYLNESTHYQDAIQTVKRFYIEG